MNNDSRQNGSDELLKKISSVFEKEIIPREILQKIDEDIKNESRKTRAGIEKMFGDFVSGFQSVSFEKHFAKKAGGIKESQHRMFDEAFLFFREQHRKLVTAGTKLNNIAKFAGKELESLDREELSSIPDEYFENTIFALAKLAELRDPETGFHLERTREYSVLLARQMGLDEDFVRLIYRVGPLHDIGKVGIRDSILLKPGRLSDEEYGEMKRHTVIGKDTIINVIGRQETDEGFIKMAEEIVLSHHEKFDGNGYPEGLEGEGIPLSARIFALADAYDAIVSKRPYKEPLPHTEAVERIIRDSGTHFDPEIVKAFVEVETGFLEINRNYS